MCPGAWAGPQGPGLGLQVSAAPIQGSPTLGGVPGRQQVIIFFDLTRNLCIGYLLCANCVLGPGDPMSNTSSLLSWCFCSSGQG